MKGHRLDQLVINITSGTLLIAFFWWMVGGNPLADNARDDRPFGVPEGREFDFEYQPAVQDSRNTFLQYPNWTGGFIGTHASLHVEPDGQFRIAEHGRVIHSGHISCIKDPGPERDEFAMGRFRVDFVYEFGMPSQTTNEWICTYQPHPKLKGPSWLWTPLENGD